MIRLAEVAEVESSSILKVEGRGELEGKFSVRVFDDRILPEKGDQIIISLDDTGAYLLGVINKEKNDDKLPIYLHDREGNGKFSIKSDGAINLASKDSLTAKITKDIEVEGKGVKITAQNEVSLSGIKAKIEAGGNSLGAVVEDIVKYLTIAMALPATPGAPLDPAASASLVPIQAKLQNFK